MLPEDLQNFLAAAQEHDPIVVVPRSSDSPEARPSPNPSAETEVMTLWNKNLLTSLKRKHIVVPGRDYYMVDLSLPTLELSPSRLLAWAGRPALLQGRIYVFFDKPTTEYEQWYKALSSWIRRHFIKNPLIRLSGYVGPAALKWFETGGILLPTFVPPENPEWRKFAEDQHKT